MAQWESARLEAEARLVRESKIVTTNPSQDQLIGSSTSGQIPNKATTPPARPQCLDVLKAWQGVVSGMFGVARDLESPTSTLSFQENMLAIPTVGFGDNFVGNSTQCFEKSNQMQGLKEKLDTVIGLHDDEMTYSAEGAWFQESFRTAENIMEGLSDMLVCESGDHHQQSSSMDGENSSNNGAYNANFDWNSIVNLVNASTTWSCVCAVCERCLQLGSTCGVNGCSWLAGCVWCCAWVAVVQQIHDSDDGIEAWQCRIWCEVLCLRLGSWKEVVTVGGPLVAVVVFKFFLCGLRDRVCQRLFPDPQPWCVFVLGATALLEGAEAVFFSDLIFLGAVVTSFGYSRLF
ncbi:hypothetical protein JRO89_XS05G0039800 [Xanthoceras sorbifolium]|uniref:Uncharacterized protein n=1 Tax=Xanthoceras sorbifolium TaxID=99658 RepID=A0ABQ8I0H5_9ROSI|nr:hypothetical protein JRO89_XS05G0039800 [Xanthoceras sorbifolium]